MSKCKAERLVETLHESRRTAERCEKAFTLTDRHSVLAKICYQGLGVHTKHVELGQPSYGLSDIDTIHAWAHEMFDEKEQEVTWAT